MINTQKHAKFVSNVPMRAILSRAVAREIFVIKSNLGLESAHRVSCQLAAKYRISSKAIRDIWKGRSWLEATFDLWSEEDRPPRRLIGRPKGKKDIKPRRAKGQSPSEQEVLDYKPHYAMSARSPASMEARGYFDECSADFTQQMDLYFKTASCPSPSFRFGERNPWMDQSEQQTAAPFLPRFGCLMNGMGLPPAIPDGPAYPAATPAAGLRFPSDCRPLPTPSMQAGVGLQGSLLALVASHLLSSRTTWASRPASSVPTGLNAGFLFT